MDARRKDEMGKTICPSCGKHYYPELGERDPNMLIQVQFPNATPAQREQLITGICSDKCFPGRDRFSRNKKVKIGVLGHFIKR